MNIYTCLMPSQVKRLHSAFICAHAARLVLNMERVAGRYTTTSICTNASTPILPLAARRCAHLLRSSGGGSESCRKMQSVHILPTAGFHISQSAGLERPPQEGRTHAGKPSEMHREERVEEVEGKRVARTVLHRPSWKKPRRLSRKLSRRVAIVRLSPNPNPNPEP